MVSRFATFMNDASLILTVVGLEEAAFTIQIYFSFSSKYRGCYFFKKGFCSAPAACGPLLAARGAEAGNGSSPCRGQLVFVGGGWMWGSRTNL